MRATLICTAAACILAAAASAVAQDLAPQLTNRLVTLSGKRTQPVADQSIKDANYIALYYSAGWCGPCRAFTPELVRFYNEYKAKIPGFELVFMSQDNSEPEMEKYMADMSMPWPALRYTSVRTSPTLMRYGGPGIPCLVLLNSKGEVLSHSYDGKRYIGPGKVMEDIRKLANGGAAPPPASASASVAPAAVSGSPAKTNSTDGKSPSGTNWDEVFKKKTPP
jgi:nucleoredoxin